MKEFQFLVNEVSKVTVITGKNDLTTLTKAEKPSAMGTGKKDEKGTMKEETKKKTPEKKNETTGKDMARKEKETAAHFNSSEKHLTRGKSLTRAKNCYTAHAHFPQPRN